MCTESEHRKELEMKIKRIKWRFISRLRLFRTIKNKKEEIKMRKWIIRWINEVRDNWIAMSLNFYDDWKSWWFLIYSRRWFFFGNSSILSAGVQWKHFCSFITGFVVLPFGNLCRKSTNYFCKIQHQNDFSSKQLFQGETLPLKKPQWAKILKD